VVDHTFHTLNLKLDTGDVVIKFRPDLAPNHVRRIGELANEGFYDGVPFHQAQPEAGILARAARARRLLDGARQ
jgi:peptidylprolyl isomerase